MPKKLIDLRRKVKVASKDPLPNKPNNLRTIPKSHRVGRENQFPIVVLTTTIHAMVQTTKRNTHILFKKYVFVHGLLKTCYGRPREYTYLLKSLAWPQFSLVLQVPQGSYSYIWLKYFDHCCRVVLVSSELFLD